MQELQIGVIPEVLPVIKLFSMDSSIPFFFLGISFTLIAIGIQLCMWFIAQYYYYR
jgi:uncharacterized membrane protein